MKRWTCILTILWAISVLEADLLTAGMPFVRGDVDQNGEIEIADAIRVLGYLFRDDPSSLECLEAADLNSDREVDLSDAVYVLFYLFLGVPPPAAPFPACGIDPAGAPLGCKRHAHCSIMTAVPPGGGVIEVPAVEMGLVTVTIPAGVFTSTAEVVSSEALDKPPQVDGEDVPVLPQVTLSFDGMWLNPAIDEETIDISFAPVAGGAGGEDEAIEDAAIFVKTPTQEFVYIVTVESGPPGGGFMGVVKVPAAIFKKAREWAVIGKESFISQNTGLQDKGLVKAIFKGFTDTGKAIIDAGGIVVEGTADFLADTGKVVVHVVVDGVEQTVEFTVGTVEVVVDAVANLWKNWRTTIASIVGDGKLYRVNFSPDISLEKIKDGTLETGCNPSAVIVHGFGIAEPLEILGSLNDPLGIKRLIWPKTEEDVKERLMGKSGWASLLAYLKEDPGCTGTYYLYSYVTARSIRENGKSFAWKLQGAFDWKDRRCPITFVCHSMGGLITSVALDDAVNGFGLDNDLPEDLNVITLGTPFRGTPWANPGFQAGLDLKGFLKAAKAKYVSFDPAIKAKYTADAIACLAASAFTMLFTKTPGALDLDLNKLWDVTGKSGLTTRLMPWAGDFKTLLHPCSGFLSCVFLPLGEYLLSKDANYSSSDGIVPLYSALRRSTEFDNDSPASGSEIIFVGDDHLYLPNDPGVFSRLVFGGLSLTNSVGMKLVYIPPGSFLMGSPDDERNRVDWEGPQHRVNLTKGFYIGVTEVTQGQYQTVMGTNPSFFNGVRRTRDYGTDLTRPVEQVNWDDAQAFCTALSAQEDRSYRLPTEAQWEYACRAGTTTRYSFGNAMECDDQCAACPAADNFLWYCTNSNLRTHSVGTKKANPWCLFDMHGNVWEWCEDWWADYSGVEETDPMGPTTGDFRVLRGGGFYVELYVSRSALRIYDIPEYRPNYGFRVVLVSGLPVEQRIQVLERHE